MKQIPHALDEFLPGQEELFDDSPVGPVCSRCGERKEYGGAADHQGGEIGIRPPWTCLTENCPPKKNTDTERLDFLTHLGCVEVTYNDVNGTRRWTTVEQAGVEQGRGSTLRDAVDFALARRHSEGS